MISFSYEIMQSWIMYSDIFHFIDNGIDEIIFFFNQLLKYSRIGREIIIILSLFLIKKIRYRD